MIASDRSKTLEIAMAATSSQTVLDTPPPDFRLLATVAVLG
jgi:hypothetical protein